MVELTARGETTPMKEGDVAAAAGSRIGPYPLGHCPLTPVKLRDDSIQQGRPLHSSLGIQPNTIRSLPHRLDPTLTQVYATGVK